jgi:RND superfamily putative drug exporter
VLLVLVFGSLIAAGVPIVLGVFGVVSSLAVLWIVSLFTDISIFALNTASMIGLGLAIDFSLIMVSRFREELARSDLETALDRTLQTAGRSITFSGITLMLTMAVLTLFPIMVIRSIALAIVVVAAVSITVALFLLPAMLAVIHPYINSLNLRRYIPLLNRDRAGFWHRWAIGVMRRPWASLALGLLILGLLALPALWLERSGVTVEVLPKSSESRQALELVQRQFGPGEATPLLVVVHTAQPGDIWSNEVIVGVLDLHNHLKDDPRVANVRSLASMIPNPSPLWMQSLSPSSIEKNSDRKRIAERLVNLFDENGEPGDNDTTMLLVTPREKDTDEETIDLLLDIREHASEWAPGLASTQVLVGGTPAQHYDFDRVVYDQFPMLVIFSLLVTFVILMLFFHSLILPLKAILLNLISIAASYGILVLIFQFGVGDSLIGLDSIGAILSYTPVLLFAILFGLSTDYEVFLLTRVREAYLHGASNEESVAIGLERTAGIITAAGLIMIAVFGSFALTQVLVVKEIGFGLAVAVLLDTTLVRLVLVPATMKLMGDRNWWMPRVLDRIVPEIDEGEAMPAAPAVAGTASGGS